MAFMERNMEARVSLLVWHEKKRLPASLDQNLCCLKMAFIIKASWYTIWRQVYLSLFVMRRRLKKLLPASLDQSLCNLKLAFIARNMEARATVFVCLQ